MADTVSEGQRWQHVKRGTEYEVIGLAGLQIATGDLVDGSTLVVYRGDDGKLWAREEGEFTDGRFTLASTQPAPAFPREEVDEAALVKKALSIATYGQPAQIAVQVATNAVRVTVAALLQGKQP